MSQFYFNRFDIGVGDYVNEVTSPAKFGGGLTMTSCPVGNKTSLSRKPCIADNSYYGSLSLSLGRLVIFKKKQQILI